jgi:hypothetical protein
MPPTAFTLQIPADPRYAAVAADAAGKFVELMGGKAAEAAAFGAALAKAARDLAARSHGPLTVAFSLQPAGVEAVVEAGAAGSVTLHQPMTASQPSRRS